jgi:hypothetical protein
VITNLLSSAACEAFFGGFEGGYNKDMADAGARQLGLKTALRCSAK